MGAACLCCKQFEKEERKRKGQREGKQSNLLSFAFTAASERLL
jgi:hypothetical protein